MTETPDADLLKQFARDRSEAAFTALVERHIGLVHSVALRHTANPQHAQDITQMVFIILARKAAALGRKTVLPGWLHHTARLVAANFQRTEFRRIRREQEVFMQSTLNESAPDPLWTELSPLLDEAMSRLRAGDRDALVLRYFQNKSLAEVGVAMGLAERAAQKRVLRAVEKLRSIFAKRGVSGTTEKIAETISANSIQAVSPALVKAVAATAFAKGATASISTLTLIKGALKIMAWTKAKTAIIAGAVTLLAAGTTTFTVKEIIRMHQPPIWQQTADMAKIDKLPPQVAILPSLPSTKSSGTHVAQKVGNGKIHGLGQSIPDIVMAAYGYRFHLAQLSFPSTIPQGKYDYISNLPKGQPEALQAELKKKFGLVGHLETNEVNCLILKVKSRNAPGLKRSSLPFSGSEQDGSYSGHNQSLWALVDYLASHLGTIVLDRTGLTGALDIDFTWDKTPDGLKQALLEQTGLELVSAKEPAEFLVVEDMNHPVVDIGAGLAIDEQTGQLQITSVYPNSAAAEAGLSVGSVIQRINGIPTGGKSLSECVEIIRGQAGTKIQLEIVTPDGSNTNAMELTRRKIQL